MIAIKATAVASILNLSLRQIKKQKKPMRIHNGYKKLRHSSWPRSSHALIVNIKNEPVSRCALFCNNWRITLWKVYVLKLWIWKAFLFFVYMLWYVLRLTATPSITSATFNNLHSVDSLGRFRRSIHRHYNGCLLWCNRTSTRRSWKTLF